MFTDILLVTASQMAVLLFFMLIGCLLFRTKKVGEGASDAVSTLLLYIFMPATCFKTFAEHCTPEVLVSRLPLILAGFATLFGTLGLGWLVSRFLTKNPRGREIYTFSLVVSNLGYLGYPLVDAVFGGDVLFDFMVFCMPFNMFIYSFGMYLLNPQKKLTVRIFSSPAILSIIAGIAVGLSGIVLPAPVAGAVSAASACMAPCAMLVIGIVLAGIPIRTTFTDGKVWIVSLLRLIGLPMLACGLALLLHLDREMSMILMAMLCLPAGLNGVVFTKAYGGDSDSAAKLSFLTNLLGIVTIPLLYALAGAMFGGTV